MDIPYTTTARPDTGVNNPTLGIWLFLSSEIMLFGSLFSAYALIRGGAAQWPDQSSILSVPLGTINTVLLVLSSVTLGRALSALRGSTDGRGAGSYRLLMGATILLGLLFLGIKGFEWNDKLAHGLVPATNNFLGLYFTMTGVHAAHLVAGILVNAYLLGPGMRLWRTEPERYVGRVTVARLYWNLVDAVWIALFVVLHVM